MNARYHGLDSMRATMMLLGIYLHVVVGYSGDGHWPYIDPHPTSVLNFTLGIIHAFRMPAFFVMAGFFGSLLWNGRGPSAFFTNRTNRVFWPFVIFWSLLFPVMGSIVIGLERGWSNVVPTLFSREALSRLHPMHLWFLEYLLLLYALGAFVAWMLRRYPMRGVHAAYRWILSRSYAPVLWAAVSWLPLGSMGGNLKDCDGFMPELRILSAYIPPFAFGWLLYHHRDLLDRFRRHIGTYLLLAVPAFLAYGMLSAREHPLLKSGGNVLFCWFLIFACTGLFLKYCDQPSARWRYLSDSSYWLYIMHMPVVVGLQVALLPVPLPALAKVPIVLAISVVLLLLSYDLLVRGTRIGVLLNGRRYPRALRWPGATARGEEPAIHRLHTT